MDYIVIPEGIAADERGYPAPAPSFVYRQVLDYALAACAPGDTLHLAPANTYGGQTEHKLALRYLQSRNAPCHISCPAQAYDEYVDTRGNARHLRAFLGDSWRQPRYELVCASLHSYRCQYCFRHEGYRLGKVHRVPYVVTGERIFRRWWYYRYPAVHFIYEALALGRDLVKGLFARRCDAGTE